MVTISCEICGTTFEAARRSRKYCGNRCRVRAQGAKEVKALPPPKAPEAEPESDLVAAVRSELSEMDVAASSAGKQAISMAQRMASATSDTGSSYAALSRELSRLLTEAKDGSTAKADPLDELRERREQRRISA